MDLQCRPGQQAVAAGVGVRLAAHFPRGLPSEGLRHRKPCEALQGLGGLRSTLARHLDLWLEREPAPRGTPARHRPSSPPEPLGHA